MYLGDICYVVDILFYCAFENREIVQKIKIKHGQ